MKKTYCDKCGIELWKVYTLKVKGFDEEARDPYNNNVSGFIYRKQGGYVSEFHFCGECINELSKTINKFLKDKNEI